MTRPFLAADEFSADEKLVCFFHRQPVLLVPGMNSGLRARQKKKMLNTSSETER